MISFLWKVMRMDGRFVWCFVLQSSRFALTLGGQSFFFSKSHISRQVEDVYNLRGIKDNDIMKARKATKGLPVGWIGWVDFGWTYWFVLVRKERKTRQQLGRFTWCKKQFRVFQLMLIWRRGRDAGFKLVSWSSRKIAEGYDVVSKAIPDSIRPSYSTLLTYW